ncbi:MAG: hypothetical protein ACI9F9_003060 [Candidatus Paceibacteria bacterium]|jgi:hypothetical protein
MKLIQSIAIGALVPVGVALSLQVHVEPDQNNISAGRLEGIWRSDPAVSTRLGLDSKELTIEFQTEDRFMKSLSKQVSVQLNEQRIYETGLMVTRQAGKLVSSSPYFLVSRSGDPYLLQLHAEDGVPLGGIDSTHVFVAPGRERHQDLLLLGGDINDEALRPYRRVRE